MSQMPRAFVLPNAPITDAKLLPNLPPVHVFGRNRELASGHVALKAGTTIFLHGPAGIGKTTIASVLAAAHTAENRGSVLWLTLAEDDADLLMVRVARAYGITTLSDEKDPAARAHVVRSLLENNRPLLVFDGLADANAIREFVRQVAVGNPTIVTDTTPTAGPWTPVPLGVLSGQASAELLRSHAGLAPDVDIADVSGLATLLNGDPLSLELAGRHLAAQNSSPSDLLNELLDLVRDEATNDDPRQAVFSIAFKSLSALAQGLVLAYGAWFTTSVGAELIAALGSAPADQMAAAMRQLSDRGLVRRSISYGQARYTIHESIQAYARRLLIANKRLASVEGRALQTLSGYVTRHAHPEPSDQDRLAAEMENVVNAAAYATQSGQEQAVRDFIQVFEGQTGNFVAERGFQVELDQLHKLLRLTTQSSATQPATAPGDSTMTMPVIAVQQPKIGSPSIRSAALATPTAPAPPSSPDPNLVSALKSAEPPITPDMSHALSPLPVQGATPQTIIDQPSQTPTEAATPSEETHPLRKPTLAIPTQPQQLHDLHTPQPPGRQPLTGLIEVIEDVLSLRQPELTNPTGPINEVHDLHTPQPNGRQPITSTDTTQEAPVQPIVPETTGFIPIAPIHAQPGHMPEVESYILNKQPGGGTASTPAQAQPIPVMPTPAPAPDTPPPVAPTEHGPLSVAELQARIASARTADDKKSLAEYSLQLGDLYLADRDTARAIPTYMQAVEALQPGEDWGAIGLAMSKLGNAYQSGGQWPEAAQIFEQTAAMFRHAKQPVDEARALESLGNCYDAVRDWPNAQQAHQQALAAARTNGDQHLEAAQLGNLAYVYEVQGHQDDAVTAYRQGLHVAYATGNNDLAAQYAFRLGGLLIGDGRTLGQSVALLEEANAHAPDDGDVQRLLKRGKRLIDHLQSGGIAIPEAIPNATYAADAYPAMVSG